MKKTIAIFSMLFSAAFSYGQTVSEAQLPVDCINVVIRLDTASYNAVFTNTYIRDTLFACKEQTSKTTTETYTNKYAWGQSACMEFEVDSGSSLKYDGEIEFKTRTLGDLPVLEERAKQLNIKVDTAATVYDDSSTYGRFTWFKSVGITDRFAVLEYQKEFLKLARFTDEEINAPMTYAYFNNHIRAIQGHKFERQFSEIKSITIEGNKALLENLSSFCRLIGVNQNGNVFYNANVKFYFKQNDAINNMKIDEVEISLLSEQPKRLIKITKNIVISVKGKTAEIHYQ